MSSLVKKCKKIGKSWQPTLAQTDKMLIALSRIRGVHVDADMLIDCVLDYRSEAQRG